MGGRSPAGSVLKALSGHAERKVSLLEYAKCEQQRDFLEVADAPVAGRPGATVGTVCNP